MQSSLKKLYLFATFLVLYEFTTYAANDMIMPGMVQVIGEFHVSASFMAMSMIAYLLGNAILTPIIGPLSDRYGNRLVILIGAMFFTVSSFLLIFSHSIGHFLFVRVLEGVGLSVIAAGYALIHKNFNDEMAVKITALMANVAILAPLLGPMMGAVIISHFNWRVIFYVIVVMAIVALIGLFKYIPEHDTEVKSKSLRLGTIVKDYTEIIQNKNFIMGVTIMSASAITFIEWIGLSPSILLYKMHLSYFEYTVYQVIAIGGVSLSSILMQFISGRVVISKLLKSGVFCIVIAIVLNIIAIFLTDKLDLISIGFFIAGFGGGLVGGVVIRIVLSDKSVSSNYIMSAIIFIQMLLTMIMLDISNRIVSFFDYSLNCLSIVNVMGWILLVYVLNKFRNMHKDRAWE
jgi:MFS transporter, DHA1 family, multidrug/chloramphenicol efflux transport protein